jgi:thioredoxin-like negative regulator of GroEL
MLRKVKSLVLTSSLLVSAVALPVLAAADSQAQKIQCGKDCIKKGQYNQAVQDLTPVVTKDPNSCEGHLLLGQAYCKLHNYIKGRDQLRAAVRTGHGSANAQQANALLMTLPKQYLSPKTGPSTRLLASMLGLTSTRGMAGKPTIIDFYAPWCVPCKQLNTVLDKVKIEYGDKINFMTVNVDDPTNGKLVDQYEVSPIPTLVYLNPEGEVVTFSIGYSGETIVSESVKKILAQQS